MPQLNAAVGNIQLKSNMIISSDAATAPWSDAYYPSAKTVADKINAATGDILITSTNTNPGTLVGGTWELIDKVYNNDKLHLNAGASSWSVGSASLTSGVIIKADHNSRVSLTLTTTTSLSSSSSTSALKLGTISPATVGAGEIPLIAFGVSDLVDGIVQAVNKEGTETYDIQYKIDANGNITIAKIFNNKTLPVGTVINITTFIPMHKDFMADSACDKFYWKRRATQSSTSEPIETPASEGLEYTLNDDGISYSVSGIGICEDTDMVIPSRYNNLPVTSIGNSAFSECASLTSVIIGDGVTSIGNNAFYMCTNLTSVIIPSGVTSIGMAAFVGCNFTSIDIPNGVTSIGAGAFVGCDNLISVTIPNSVASIGHSVFTRCTNLTIYCEATSQPEGWDTDWNPDNKPVVWGA